MEERLVTFETGKLAKEKGFSNGGKQSYCEYLKSYVYDSSPSHPESYKKGEIALMKDFYTVNNYKAINNFNKNYILYEAPSQSLLQKWLREAHQIFIDVQTDCTSSPKFCIEIHKFFGNPTNLAECEWSWIKINLGDNWGLYRKHEDALEIGLQEALKTIEL